MYLKCNDFPPQLPQTVIDSFNELMRRISSKPVLTTFDYDSKSIPEVHIDGSKIGISAILLQDGKAVNYFSRQITDTERRYSITEIEMLALVYGINKNSIYLRYKPFHIITDHIALQYIGSAVSESARIERLFSKVRHSFTFKIIYKPGRLHYLPDWLSRQPNQNEQAKEIQLDPTTNYSTYSATIENTKYKLPEDDEIMQPIVDALNSNDNIPKRLQHKIGQFFIKQNELFKRGNKTNLKYVEPSKREIIMEQFYQLGHLSDRKLLNKIIYCKLWWPKIAESCRQYYNNCTICSSNRYNKHDRKKHLKIKANHPLQLVQMDLLHLDRDETSKKYVLTMIDQYSGFLMTNSLIIKEAAEIIQCLEHNFLFLGVSHSILVDQGTEFKNIAMSKLTDHFKIECLFSDTGNAREHGKIENINKTIRNTLRKMLANSNWSEKLSIVTYSLNTSTVRNHSNLTPYEILLGRKPRLPIGVPVSQYYGNYKEESIKAYTHRLQMRLNEIAEILKSELPGQQQPLHDFKEEEEVYVRQRKQNKDFKFRNYGPVKIIEVDPTHLKVMHMKSKKTEWIHYLRCQN